MRALLLIDFQESFCGKGSVIAPEVAREVHARGTLDNARQCLDAARSRGDLVVFVHLAFDAKHRNRTNRSFRFDEHEREQRYMAGSVDSTIVSELAPAADALPFSVFSICSSPRVIGLRSCTRWPTPSQTAVTASGRFHTNLALGNRKTIACDSVSSRVRPTVTSGVTNVWTLRNDWAVTHLYLCGIRVAASHSPGERWVNAADGWLSCLNHGAAARYQAHLAR